MSVAVPVLAPGVAETLAPPRSARLDSIDLLRGIVMVLMLLDHTRDFVHAEAFRFDPTDLSRTTPLLFLTRWITHFCAPIFVFLAGTSVFLQEMRGRSKREISRFLVTRGLWLVLLEFTVVRLGITFNVDYTFLGMMQVIWAIGVSMVVLAALIRLPLQAVAAFGVGMILFHNLFDGVQVTPWQGPGTPAPGLAGGLWMVLHQSGPIVPFGFPGPFAFVMYPLIPWIGVMAAGYAFGRVYGMPAPERRRLLLAGGAALLGCFIVLRAVNGYGDPQPRQLHERPLFTLLSFLNVTKYPPSLLFLLMTLGPAMAALAWFERAGDGPLARALIRFGRVPLFFYLLQWPVAKLLALLLGAAAGRPTAYLFLSPHELLNGLPPGAGFGLGVVYAVWIAGLLLLYPLCHWFAGVKRRRRDAWLSYL